MSGNRPSALHDPLCDYATDCAHPYDPPRHLPGTIAGEVGCPPYCALCGAICQCPLIARVRVDQAQRDLDALDRLDPAAVVYLPRVDAEQSVVFLTDVQDALRGQRDDREVL